MFDAAEIQAVTFDCYGTLIDWESGILELVGPRLAKPEVVQLDPPSAAEWLVRWEAIQFDLLKPYRPYHEVLIASYDATMHAFGLPWFSDGGPALVHSLAEWKPFPDTVPSLRRLARRRRVGIISNIDRALLAQTLGSLLAPFTMVMTAEDVQAYKPDEAPFRRALELLALPPERILHAGFGWKYDLAPARAVGMRTCWVNRGQGPQPAGDAPDLVVPSLAALAEALGA